MSDSIHLLVGAYVLDALDEPETEVFEEHLRTCEDCRREVLEMRETVAHLAAAETGPDVSGLKADVMDRLATTPQLTPVAAVRPMPRRIVSAMGWLAAAAAVVVALVLVAGIRDQRQTITAMNEHSAEVMALITQPDAKVLPLPLPDGSSTVVVSMAADEAMVMADGVDAPGEGKVYQTWAYDAQGNPSPAGTWTPDDTGHVAALVDAGLVDCTALSVTVEPAGGSPQPSSEPLAMVELV